MNKKILFLFKFWLLACLMFSTKFVFSQTLPYTFVNNSEFSDDHIYVAIVGIIDGHVWVDASTGDVHEMSVSDNTVQGPVNNGDYGPGGNGLYADCFSKLSEIPNKTVDIPQIAGCRIMMSFGEQLYLYFFGYDGGYSAPNLANPNDPNQGIRFELAELTYNSNGLWCNTTRVDVYQYPMGLEVWGTDFYQKVGEILPHNQIISLWQNDAPPAFQACLDDATNTIHFPSKTTEFQTGGSYENYFQTYIDNIWNTYSKAQLAFYSGDAGTWRGTVQNDVFTFTRDSDGQVAYIYSKPTTTEAMEGSGPLAEGEQFDKVIQAQICAAINRHALDVSITSGEVQDFSNTSAYYQTSLYNWYCKFWHQSNITYNSKTYAFCYDDVFEQSSTTHTPYPQSIKITIGGFYGIDDDNDDDDDNTETGVSGLDGTYYIENRKSGLVMDVYYGGSDDGTNILQYTNNGTTNQQFTLIEVTSGVYKIQNVNSGKVVDVSGASTDDYANVQQWTDNGSTCQQFKAISTGDGYYKFKAMHSSKIIEVVNGSVETNVNISQYTDNDQTCGQWALVPANDNITWNTSIEAENYSSSSGVENETCDEGGENVGYIDTSDWMLYSDIEIPYSGTYTFQYRVASKSTGGQLSLDYESGAVILDYVDIPVTGGWQTWTTVSSTVTLVAGTYDFGVYAQSGGWNINWISISYTGTKSAESITSSANNIQNNINIYPNPSSDIINISGIEDESIIDVFTITGTKIQTCLGNLLNVSSLNNGTYIMKITNGDFIVCKKFIKN